MPIACGVTGGDDQSSETHLTLRKSAVPPKRFPKTIPIAPFCRATLRSRAPIRRGVIFIYRVAADLKRPKNWGSVDAGRRTAPRMYEF